MELSLGFWNKYVPRPKKIRHGKEIIRKIRADLNILTPMYTQTLDRRLEY